MGSPDKTTPWGDSLGRASIRTAQVLLLLVLTVVVVYALIQVRLVVIPTLLALTAGTILAGIIGAILAVPLVAVAWAAIKAWNSGGDITPEAVAEAEHETRLNEQGEGVRSKPRSARTQDEEQSDTAAADASHG